MVGAEFSVQDDNCRVLTTRPLIVEDHAETFGNRIVPPLHPSHS